MSSRSSLFYKLKLSSWRWLHGDRPSNRRPNCSEETDKILCAITVNPYITEIMYSSLQQGRPLCKLWTIYFYSVPRENIFQFTFFRGIFMRQPERTNRHHGDGLCASDIMFFSFLSVYSTALQLRLLRATFDITQSARTCGTASSVRSDGQKLTKKLLTKSLTTFSS